MQDQLYFKQLLSGTDFAVHDQMATQMINFVYLIGDLETRECIVVDPAYAVGEIASVAELDGMKITGVLGSHYHADHIGGSMMGWNIEGITTLLENYDIPVHIQRAESEWVLKTTGIAHSALHEHDSGDIVTVGNIEISLIHTPGHTPGSQCFLVGDRLVSGDTLFLEGCGRTDLPGSNPEDMYASLSLLATLPDNTVVYPGHQYSIPAHLSLGQVKTTNYVYKPTSKEGWLAWFGH